MTFADPDIKRALVDELSSLGSRFAADELAYLALTSKVELPVRDKLGFALHQRLQPLLVAREWRRTDLAVLDSDGTTPRMLLEAKAMYTFDLVDVAGDRPAWVARFPAMVVADLEKMSRMSGVHASTPLYALVLATHPATASAGQLRQVVKYARPYAKALAAFSSDTVLERADRAINDALSPFGAMDSGKLPAGTAFGVPVTVRYWLLGPIDRNAVTATATADAGW